MSDNPEYPLLSRIETPADLKQLKMSELLDLSKELRTFLIDTVSKTGGHLGSNLGAVELTIAIHRTYDAPNDLIVWDVGSQAYPHKILTGRMKRFHTNRQYGGISGFPLRDESIYDTFTVGHSSTSISAALGMATALRQRGIKQKVLAVIGDGGMMGGLAFEGLNNAGATDIDLTVVLNDNRMAIRPSVGALSKYLSAVITDTRYEKLKDSMWNITAGLPKSSKIRKALHGVDTGLRSMIVPGLWFERLGFRYVGPIDGHNLNELVKVFKWLRGISGPILLHVLTEKGKGYKFAEQDSTRMHGVNKFDPATGTSRKVKTSRDDLSFSAYFSSELLKIAEKDDRIVAITPAMIEGSALVEFQETFPERCFDVGIAEQHALTFAAGMITQGLKPVVAIYSTFLQRAFDQLIHDIALPRLPVILGIDRAGIVGEDGPTHHGNFDLSYLRHVPNVTILIPRDGLKLRQMLRAALDIKDGPVAIRFPRGVPPEFDIKSAGSKDVLHPEMLRNGKDGLIIGVGILLSECLNAANEIQSENGLELAVLDLQCLKPLDTEFLTVLAARYNRWITIEENTLPGGMGSAMLEFLSDRGLDVSVRRLGLPDRFITHGDRQSLLKEVGLDIKSMKANIISHFTQDTRVKKRRIRTLKVET